MKFPTNTRVVPELALTQSECDRYRLKAKVLVEDAIAQYETYARMHKRQLSRNQWRVVKKREGLTIYRERRRHVRRLQHGHHHSHSHDNDDEHDNQGMMMIPEPLLTPSTVRSTLSPDMNTSSSNPFAPPPTTRDSDALDAWPLPTLLMVGSIVGTLDDVMFGAATFDAPSMLLKTTYTHDELLDGEVLSQIDGPTREDPFRFLGLKWIVKGAPPGMSKIMRPRDLVFLEATGIDARWNGERYGYHLMHSEDVDSVGPLPIKSGVRRGRIEACTIYRQLANGTVDVYMRANFDPNGHVRESFALVSAANGLSYSWRSVVCAQHKKLAHLLTQRQAEAAAAAAVTGGVGGSSVASRRVQGKSVCCSVCRKTASRFRTLQTCELCDHPMCSKCKVVKKISVAGNVRWRRKEIVSRDVALCKSCVTRAAQTDAFVIARDDVVAGMWDVHGGSSGAGGVHHHHSDTTLPILPMPSRSSSAVSSIYEEDDDDVDDVDDDDVDHRTTRHSARRRSTRKPQQRMDRMEDRRRDSDTASFYQTLKLSLARIDANEVFGASSTASSSDHRDQPHQQSVLSLSALTTLSTTDAPSTSVDHDDQQQQQRHWASSFDSNDKFAHADDDDSDELEQEYYFDEQGRASEVPRGSSFASSTSSATGVSLRASASASMSYHDAGDATSEFRYSRPQHLVDLLSDVEAPITRPTAVATASLPPQAKPRTRSTSSPPKFHGHTRSLSNASSASSSSGQNSSSNSSSGRGVRYSLDPTLSAPSQQQQPLSSSFTQPPTTSTSQQQQQQQQSRHTEMWKQMLQLRDAAEHVYQVTRQNSEVHANGSAQVWPSVRS